MTLSRNKERQFRSIFHIIGLDKQIFQRKIVNFFLPINFSICFGCTKVPTTYVLVEK